MVMPVSPAPTTTTSTSMSRSMAGNAGKVWVADQYDMVSMSLSLVQGAFMALMSSCAERRACSGQPAHERSRPVDPPPVYPLITSPPLGCRTCPAM